MKGKTHSTEEIIRILRQVAGGETAQAICREHNISEQTFYRWKKKYGAMELADAIRLTGLEKENADLKKMLAESMLENRVLKEVNSKNGEPCTEKNGRRPCRDPATVLGAQGLSLSGFAAFNLPLCGPTGLTGARSPPAASSAHCGAIVGLSTLWLSADS